MLLEYIAHNYLVQIAFMLALVVGFIGWMANRRLMKSQEYDREEKKESRRERFMALPNGKKAQTIDGE